MKRIILTLTLCFAIFYSPAIPAAEADIIQITVTAEEVKAVEGIVPDAQAWLQEAWNMKAANSTESIIRAEAGDNLCESKSKQEKMDWIKNNTFKTRIEKDLENQQ